MLLLIAISVISTTMTNTPATMQRSTADCTRGATDTRINQCLVARIHAVRTALTSALEREGVTLGTGSRPTSMVARAESDFERYVRTQCLAQANPYRGGSIVPIIFGRCEVALLSQRLMYVRHVSALVPPY